uniref:RmlD-like substrate binding domain-containing protein n=1 Tax=Coccolithus braarudii TaxID=221442 RepID=A0A7S0LAY0_9EUKA
MQGEREVLAADPTALVIRTNVVYGPEAVGKNFVYQLMRKLRAGEKMNCPSDQVNTPTYNRDLAEATKLLAERKAAGVFNVSGDELLGRYDFGLELAKAFNELIPDAPKLDTSLIASIATSNSGQAALRPLASGLKSEKLRAALPGWKPRTVREALTDWVTNPTGKALGD